MPLGSLAASRVPPSGFGLRCLARDARLVRACAVALRGSQRFLLTAPPLPSGAPLTTLESHGSVPSTNATATTPSTLSSSSPLLPTPSPSAVADASLLRVSPLAALPERQQEHLLQLRMMLARSARLARNSCPAPLSSTCKGDHGHGKRRVTHVACRVECDDDDGGARVKEEPTASPLLLLSSATTTHEPSWFTGVNHALHACVNGEGGGNGGVLKGILKGCAEQNALGALAAGGVPYTRVSRAYLASSYPDPLREEEPRGCSGQGCGGRVFFPCPECWRHLTRVAEMRVATGLPAIELLVWVGSAAEVVEAATIATKRAGAHQGLVRVVFVTEG